MYLSTGSPIPLCLTPPDPAALLPDPAALLQVERLSGLLQKAQKLLESSSAQQPPVRPPGVEPEMDPPTLRLTTINSSVNIHQRIVRFFEMVESDLYGKLQGCNAQIAVSYRA